jgi:hypothetical protein
MDFTADSFEALFAVGRGNHTIRISARGLVDSKRLKRKSLFAFC